VYAGSTQTERGGGEKLHPEKEERVSKERGR
jgi:hypothetical protein